MADTVSKKRRSEIMRAVKSKNTKPEITVRNFLFSKGFRFRLHDKKLPGSPDIKLAKHNTVIFVNGCFWHGHEDCRIYVMPRTNKKFWYSKIQRNIERDKLKISQLKKLGWKVLVLWECDLKKKEKQITLDNLVNKILE